VNSGESLVLPVWCGYRKWYKSRYNRVMYTARRVLSGSIIVLAGLVAGFWVGAGFEGQLEGERARVLTAPTLVEPAGQIAGEMMAAGKVVQIRAVGDVMLGRSVQARTIRYGDWVWPFGETAGYLRETDMTIGNLENPLTYECPETNEGMIFCGRAEMAEGLTAAGFDVVSLANNHAHNYGARGLAETEEILTSRKITGLQPYETSVYGAGAMDVGVMGLDDVTMRVNTDLATAALSTMSADLKVVIIHWGDEYQDQPNERQVKLGRELVDGGADVVIGAHPHWVQPVEEYRGRLIFYSLGNFVFDQMWSDETRQGGIVTVNAAKRGDALELAYGWQETLIQDYGQPSLVASGSGLAVLQ
jgi:hypothetical protein